MGKPKAKGLRKSTKHDPEEDDTTLTTEQVESLLDDAFGDQEDHPITVAEMFAALQKLLRTGYGDVKLVLEIKTDEGSVQGSLFKVEYDAKHLDTDCPTCQAKRTVPAALRLVAQQ